MKHTTEINTIAYNTVTLSVYAVDGDLLEVQLEAESASVIVVRSHSGGEVVRYENFPHEVDESLSEENNIYYKPKFFEHRREIYTYLVLHCPGIIDGLD